MVIIHPSVFNGHYCLSSLAKVKTKLVELAHQYGFQDARVSDVETGRYFEEFKHWVAEGNHGCMSYLERNQDLRQFPSKLHPETCRVISLRFDYLPEGAGFTRVLKNPDKANISRYALGRDYHKLIRKRLQQLANALRQQTGEFSYRVFVDSAPVLETSFAEKSGLGWKGKHTLTINKNAGSWFFLGEIFIDLALEVDKPVENQCGQCTACINLCPTGAIVAPYKVDARRCISYLTIENDGAIPVELRTAMGNRIYGCDDCQLACPWNRYANLSQEKDFSARHNLDDETLLNLFNWTEQQFNQRLEGNPIRRIGYQNWLRNIAVALGNSIASEQTVKALQDKKADSSELVIEHIEWAINQQLTADKKNEQPESQRKARKLIRTIEKMNPRDA
jgi:epoxyqueuosine reductase